MSVSDQLFVTITITITSSGSVYYVGNPTITPTITGTGEVIQLPPSSPPILLCLAGPQPLVPPVILELGSRWTP